jgi:hypothetical protein
VSGEPTSLADALKASLAAAQAPAKQPVNLAELATNLSTLEDWFRQDCTARHAEDMADIVHEAWSLVEDLCDEVQR